MRVCLLAIISMLQQSAAEDRIASYTEWLTIFTAVLAVGTLGLFGISLWQGQQIKREFISTFRPRLRVRRVSIQATAGVGGAYPIGSLQFILANVGGSPATILEGRTVHQLIVKGTRLPPAPPYDDPTNSEEMPPGIVLKSGASMPIIHHGDNTILPTLGFAFVEHNDLFFFGYVEYADDNGTPRRMAFCRRMDAEGRFVVAENEPDYEYQD